MIDEVIAKNLQDLMITEEFSKEIEHAETIADIHAIICQHGIDISLDDTETICVALSKQTDGELNEEALDGVAGGSMIIVALVLVVAAYPVCYLIGKIARNAIENSQGKF